MRRAAGPGVGVLSPVAGTLFQDPGAVGSKELHLSAPRAGQCGLDHSGQGSCSLPASAQRPTDSFSFLLTLSGCRSRPEDLGLFRRP